ncbi:hypothetical protein F5Y09DRAFT_338162 [Xylaria sp. FL1042]|nr:hypothetical protein F5Y09DRAFT_338162 [Xylaria sp. FL1042]
MCYDAISSKGGRSLGLDPVSARVKYTRRDVSAGWVVALSLFGLPVKFSGIYGRQSNPDDRLFAAQLYTMLESLIEQQLILAPRFEVQAGWLEAVEKGIERLRQGSVKRGKLVYLVLSSSHSLGYDVGFVVTTAYGSGHHIIFATNLRMLQVFSIFSEATYALSMGFLKLSILSLYGSIFPSRRFHYCLWAVATFTFFWTAASVVGAIIQCLPIEYGWDKTIQGGKCWGYGALALAVCGSVRLEYPQRFHHTRAARTSRVEAPCYRTEEAVDHSDLCDRKQVGTLDGSWTAVPSGYVSCLELTVGIFAVSSPTYRALYKRMFKAKKSAWVRAPGPTHQSWKSLLRMTLWASKPRSLNSGSQRHSDELDLNRKHQHTTTVYTDGQVSAPNQGINVTDDVEMVRHTNQNGGWARVP